jgi:hypothetical protein
MAGTRTQQALKVRFDNTDSLVKRCNSCNYYYIKTHKKCHPINERKQFDIESESEESEESLVEVEIEDSTTMDKPKLKRKLDEDSGSGGKKQKIRNNAANNIINEWNNLNVREPNTKTCIVT